MSGISDSSDLRQLFEGNLDVEVVFNIGHEIHHLQGTERKIGNEMSIRRHVLPLGEIGGKAYQFYKDSIEVLFVHFSGADCEPSRSRSQVARITGDA